MIETPGDHIHPLLNTPEPKRRFIPSKWEAKKIAYLVKAIRKGWIKVGEDESANRPKRTEFKLMWADDNKVIGGDDSKAAQRRQAIHIPAPRKRLPGHAESYRPPPEYLLSEEERAKWDDHEHRAGAFMGKSHNSMREIGLFDKLFQETFERCLDLYLCPRATVMRVRPPTFSLSCCAVTSTSSLTTRVCVSFLASSTASSRPTCYCPSCHRPMSCVRSRPSSPWRTWVTPRTRSFARSLPIPRASSSPRARTTARFACGRCRPAAASVSSTCAARRSSHRLPRKMRRTRTQRPMTATKRTPMPPPMPRTPPRKRAMTLVSRRAIPRSRPARTRPRPSAPRRPSSCR